jgi:hypothetical protein
LWKFANHHTTVVRTRNKFKNSTDFGSKRLLASFGVSDLLEAGSTNLLCERQQVAADCRIEPLCLEKPKSSCYTLHILLDLKYSDDLLSCDLFELELRTTLE